MGLGLPKDAHSLYDLVTGDMTLETTDVAIGDPVLLIGTKEHDDAVLCEFKGYMQRGGQTYFKTPFKLILKNPKPNGEPDIELQTQKTHPSFDGLMPVTACTVVAGMDLVEDTLYRIGVYESYARLAAKEFEKAKRTASLNH